MILMKSPCNFFHVFSSFNFTSKLFVIDDSKAGSLGPGDSYISQDWNRGIGPILQFWATTLL